MNLFNLHTHTKFCDGKAEPEEYVKKAIDLGYHTLGFSGHAPVPFENIFAIKDEDLETYFASIRSLKEKYKKDILILLSLEMDYIPGITKDFSEFQELGNLDYVIGGVHLIRNKERDKMGLWFIDGPIQEKYDDGFQKLYDSNPRKGVTAYYKQMLEMISTQQPDIIAHLDKIKMHNKNRFFSEEEGWYKDLVWKTLKYISTETSCIIEVNTRGLYKKRCNSWFPSPDILEQVHHLKIPLTISSDAHIPEELGQYYPETITLLKEIGFKEVVCFEENKRVTKNLY